MAGDRQSFDAFRELTYFLLSLTVLKPEGGVRLAKGENDRMVLGGWSGPTDPLPLNDGCYLRLAVTLELANTPDGPRLKVYESTYQYQADIAAQHWMFRYDYLRHPTDQHPGAHLQINANEMDHPSIRPAQTVGRIHFPTSRVSLESIIRLLVEQYGVNCNEQPEIWRSVLTESERLFIEIAHRPESGPSV